MPPARTPFPTLATILALAAAAGLCWAGASGAARFIETRSRQDVSLALQTAGYDWAEVATDGLQVRLTGTAPDEVQRFRAMAQAGTVVDSSRVIDAMGVASAETMDPPDFAVELLRNDEGIAVIGLVPADTDRGGLIARLERETAAPRVTDLLESADYPVPPGWEDALDFGLRAAQAAARAKVSIAPGRVAVRAIADSGADRARLQAALDRVKPAGVALTMDIAAPRPVIAPFTLRFLIDGAGARFDACAADTAEARAAIIDAAVAAGATSTASCTLGLGAPTPRWSEAAVAAIAAVGDLGAGTVTISDADIALVAPASVAKPAFDAAIGRLERALPPVFSLQALHEEPPAADAGPADFSAGMAADGTVTLRGRITDERMREAVESLARARFGTIASTLRTDADVPGGWSVRVIAALEALATLTQGSVTVTPDLVRLAGTSGDARASDNAASVLSRRLGAGAGYALAIRYDRRLDPALGLPDGPECVDRLNAVMAESEIGFEPNKGAIAGDPTATIGQLEAIMTECADFRIEAGGHTDAQGSEGFNADLSRARAQAIVAAMTAAGIDTAQMTARGYGESQPVATNDTEAGREANRRIEFRLLSEEPVRTDAVPAPVVVTGTTVEAPDDGADDAAARAGTAEGGATAPAQAAPDAAPAGPDAAAEGSAAAAASAGPVPAQLGVAEAAPVPAPGADPDFPPRAVGPSLPRPPLPRPAEMAEPAAADGDGPTSPLPDAVDPDPQAQP